MRDPLADRATAAADELHRALYPTDEVRPPRDDVHEFISESWPDVLRLLRQAEDELDTGVGGGEPRVSEGVLLVREASDLLELSGGMVTVAPPEVGRAYADALRQLDRMTGR
jgi:hypothetical protein